MTLRLLLLHSTGLFLLVARCAGLSFRSFVLLLGLLNLLGLRLLVARCAGLGFRSFVLLLGLLLSLRICCRLRLLRSLSLLRLYLLLLYVP